MLRIPRRIATTFRPLSQRQRRLPPNYSGVSVSASAFRGSWNAKANYSVVPTTSKALPVRRVIRLRAFATKGSTTEAISSAANLSRDEDEEDDDASNNNKDSKKHKGGPPPITKAYFDLAKARLSLLVVTTTAAGFVAAGGPISPQLDVLAAVTAGTFLCSASAGAMNQIIEVDRDRKMRRTQQRPLVSGVLSKQQATTAAVAWGMAGTSLLAVGTDPVTTALGVGNIALYAGLYTYTKPISIYNTWIGAVVGAIPPVMGWTAATHGSFLDVEALLLGSTLYLWQMPHFFALSFMHRVDYKRGGFQMVPCLEEDGERTAGIIVRYAWYLSAIPIVATLTDVTSSMFALEGIALNGYALYVAHTFHRDRTNANARTIFLTSLWYLPCLLVLFLLHSKTWDEEKDATDVISVRIADSIHSIRNTGREICPHEVAVAKTEMDGGGEQSACPITIGTEQVTTTATKVSSSLQEAKTASNTKGDNV
jgi:protoheme IX farnesyltransferase